MAHSGIKRSIYAGIFSLIMCYSMASRALEAWQEICLISE